MCVAATFYMFGVTKRPPVSVDCQAYKLPEVRQDMLRTSYTGEEEAWPK